MRLFRYKGRGIVITANDDLPAGGLHLHLSGDIPRGSPASVSQIVGYRNRYVPFLLQTERGENFIPCLGQCRESRVRMAHILRNGMQHIGKRGGGRRRIVIGLPILSARTAGICEVQGIRRVHILCVRVVGGHQIHEAIDQRQTVFIGSVVIRQGWVVERGNVEILVPLCIRRQGLSRHGACPGLHGDGKNPDSGLLEASGRFDALIGLFHDKTGLALMVRRSVGVENDHAAAFGIGLLVHDLLRVTHALVDSRSSGIGERLDRLSCRSRSPRVRPCKIHPYAREICVAVIDDGDPALQRFLQSLVLLLQTVDHPARCRLEGLHSGCLIRHGKAHAGGGIQHQHHIHRHDSRGGRAAHPGFQFNLQRSVLVVAERFPYMNAAVLRLLCYTVVIGAGDCNFLRAVSPEFFRKLLCTRRKRPLSQDTHHCHDTGRQCSRAGAHRMPSPEEPLHHIPL